MFVQCRGSLGLKLRQQSTSPAGYLTPSVNWAVYSYRAPSEAGFVLPCMNELGLGCSVALGHERSSIAAVIVFPPKRQMDLSTCVDAYRLSASGAVAQCSLTHALVSAAMQCKHAAQHGAFMESPGAEDQRHQQSTDSCCILLLRPLIHAARFVEKRLTGRAAGWMVQASGRRPADPAGSRLLFSVE